MSGIRERSLPRAWQAFKAALYDPKSTFNPWIWIYRLGKAALEDMLQWTGLSRWIPWRRLLLAFAVGLQSFVAWAYVSAFREAVVVKRWCERKEGCYWPTIHDVLVAYLFASVMFHYLQAALTSPGKVVGPSALHVEGASTKKQNQCADDTLYFPSVEYSFCRSCQIARPPRAHHCRTYGCCVLKFDHHCAWLNNCVGRDNYRSFILFMMFLSISCWYGSAMLIWTFYEPLRMRIKEHGWHWLYENGTGFLNLPPPWDIVRLLVWDEKSTTTEQVDKSQLLVDVVFPILLGVAVTLSSFLFYHVKLMTMAYTTLEHRVVMDFQLQNGHQPAWTNPYDSGCWYRNIENCLGYQWPWRIWVPTSCANQTPGALRTEPVKES